MCILKRRKGLGAQIDWHLFAQIDSQNKARPAHLNARPIAKFRTKQLEYL